VGNLDVDCLKVHVFWLARGALGRVAYQGITACLGMHNQYFLVERVGTGFLGYVITICRNFKSNKYGICIH